MDRLLITAAVLWLIAPVILLIALVIARGQVKQLRRAQAASRASAPGRPPHASATGRLAPVDLENLILLRLELQRLALAGALPAARCTTLLAALDALWTDHLAETCPRPDERMRQRDQAWETLVACSEVPPGAPPWRGEAAVARLVVEPPAAGLDLTLPDLDAGETGTQVAGPATWARPPVPAAPTPTLDPSPPRAVTPATSPWPAPAPMTRKPAPTGPSAPAPASVWRPAAPGPWELALRKLSGWPRLIAPFLVQNIGWFIGGFCLVAGVLFLIANTSGLLNALLVFASLLGTSALLLWAGYQLQRRTPTLRVASAVLLTLASLLGPLVLAVAVRLIAAGPGAGLVMGVGVLAALVALGAFAFTVHLASALLDRSLQGRYAWLLTGLAAVQLAVPLAALAQGWWLLAVLHGLLLMLLGYGLWAFTAHWLRRLFVDRRMTTWFAAGMLVYTALVSFVHLTWVWPAALPVGYFGVFLMALCVLLLPVDAAFKAWVSTQPWLSRCTFALYGLSVMAIAVALQGRPTALVTLTLGVGLYGWMTWRYRTWPPLYLMAGCVAGLYGWLVLAWLPPQWQALASLPGLLGLLALGRAVGGASGPLARQCLVAFALLLLGLTTWSLAWTTPGVPAGCATLAVAAGLTYVAVRVGLGLPGAGPGWARGDALVIALALGAVAWWPDWPAVGWATRTAVGTLVLAVLWLGLALHHPRQTTLSRRLFALGGLLSIGIALGLGVLGVVVGPAGRPEPILLFGVAGLLLLWLALSLRRRWLFYGFLGCLGAAGALAKLAWFPRPGTGVALLLLALALWGLLWRLGVRARLRHALLGAPADGPVAAGPPLGIVLPGTPAAGLFDLIRPPLAQAMVLLWTLGLLQAGLAALAGTAPLALPWTLGLAAGVGLLLVGYFRRYALVAVPMLLAIAGLTAQLALFGLPPPWLAAAAVLVALVLWQFGMLMLAWPGTGRLARVLGFTTQGRAGGRQRAAAGLCACASGVAVVPALAAPGLVQVGVNAADLLPAVVASLPLCLRLVQQDPTPGRVWPVLGALTLVAWLTAHWLHPALFVLGQPWLNGLASLMPAVAAEAVGVAAGGRLAYWGPPLRWVSGLLYLLALAGVVGLLVVDAPGLPALLVLLGIGLFPVVRPLPQAAALRGVGLLALAGGLGWTQGRGLDFALWVALLAVGGYALWAIANLVLPRWNARWPGWAVDPTTWPLAGLVLVTVALCAASAAGAWSPALALAGLTPYLFLLLANSAWPWLGWIAVSALAASGLLAIWGPAGWWSSAATRPVADGLPVTLVWLNLLFLLVPAWRRYGPALARWLRWREPALERPLLHLPFALLIGVLGLLLLVEGLSLSGPVPLGLGHPSGWLLTAALLVVTAAHGFWLRRGPVTAQVLLGAITALLIAPLLALGWRAGVPPLLALWNGLLLLAWRFTPARWAPWRAVLRPWLLALPLVGLGLLVPLAPNHPGGTVATLALLTLVTLARGWWQVSAPAVRLGLGLLLLTGYGLWLIPIPDLARLLGLLPWFALQTALLFALWQAARRRLDSLPTPVDGPDRARVLAPALGDMARVALVLVLVGFGLHVWVLVLQETGQLAPFWQLGPVADPLAAGATLLLLAGLAGLRAWRAAERRHLAYAALLLLGLLGLYGRLILWGLAPITPWDSAALLGAAALVFVLHQVLGWPALYRLALWLPVLAVASVPWHLASTWTGGTLLAAAVLYLSMAGRLRNPWPLYLGVLAMTALAYLWAPLWAARFGLLQFYIVPAAVAVLVLLQLHRRELRPAVLSSARLAALCTLYAGAGLDLFLRPGLGVFVLALVLALVSVLLGIGLRIRVFLYAGVAFLVLNVLGQLVRFYPDQGLAQAMILIGLGVVVTAGMVAFNLQREAIARRIRLARADLAEWE